MTFKLQLLGSFEPMVNNRSIQFRTDKIRALLAYLAIESSVPQSKQSLATLLWGNTDDSSARTNLRISFHRLRQALDKQSKSDISKFLFASNRQSIQLIADDAAHLVWCDVTLFQRLIAGCEAHGHQDIHFCSACLARLEQTAVLYRGEFLHGIVVDDSEMFAEWLLLQREQLHQQALKALGILVEGYLAQGHFDKVQTYAKKLLHLEPWHETAHRQLMAALALSGQREAALAQYEACRHVLWEEMGFEPGVETAVLYQKIVDNEPIDAPSAHRGQSRRAAGEDNAPQQPRHNLPSTLTPYFGREAEQKQLTQLLLNPDTRFVTLVGEGGVGKTRLSQEVARHVLNGFADGVWLVRLAGIAPAADSDTIQDDMVTAVAQALHYSLSGTASPKTQLINFLKSRHLLLILDNFEHLLHGADLVYDLLAETTAVSVLCSSRIPLGFMAEYIMPVQQLPLPILPEKEIDLAESPPLDLSGFASVQLFSDRARRMTGWFDLGEHNQEQVATLCHLVAGNPLGIELAAASLMQRTLPETIAAIQQSLDSVAARFRDMPERHRSMRAVFENSWMLLAADEQRLLAQLSHFRGGFLPAAAAAITGANPSALVTLQAHSLLMHGDGRYHMHELLRQFAAEKLVEQTMRVSEDPHGFVSQKHSRYFLNFLAERESALAGAAPQIPAAEITADLNNIRQAWDMAAKNHDVAHILSGLNAFADYLQLRGRYREAERLFGETAERLAEVADGGETAVVTTTRLMIHKTAALVRLSRYDEAIALAQASLSKAEQANDAWSQGYAHLHWGEALWRQGEYHKAINQIKAGLNLAIERGLKQLEGSCHFHLNIIFYYLSEFELAEKHVIAALEIWSLLNNQKQEAYSSNSLGLIHYALGSYEKASLNFNLTLDLANQIGDLQAQTHALNNLSMIATSQKKFDVANEYLIKSLQLANLTYDKNAEANAQYNLGWNAFQANNLIQAKEWLEQALSLCQQIQNQQLEAFTLKVLGDIAIKNESTGAARKYYQTALKIGTKIGNIQAIQETTKALETIKHI